LKTIDVIIKLPEDLVDWARVNGVSITEIAGGGLVKLLEADEWRRQLERRVQELQSFQSGKK
jgi:hypothetical protein